VAHYLAGDKPLFLLPPTLIGALAVSYLTRSSDRRISEAICWQPERLVSDVFRDGF
jgi:hypothetical protein